ncbi:hypothetical protein H9X77_13275, partial [Clostridium saudiense]|nr:hypothetical protein [Clostridium saudiense]
TTLCNGNGDKEIKRLLIHFIDAEFKKPTNLYFDAKVGVNEYFYGLDKFIYIVRDFSITDISWKITKDVTSHILRIFGFKLGFYKSFSWS